MAKPRIHEIARDLGADSKVLLALVMLDGESFIKSPSNTVEPPVARRLRALWERDGDRFVRGRDSPEIAALGALEWVPRAMPSIIDRTVNALLDLSPTAQTPKLLDAARSERRFAYVTGSLDDAETTPLPPPPTGIVYLADTEQVLAWAGDRCVLMSWSALSAARPAARIRSVGASETDAVIALRAFAAMRTPDLESPRSSSHVPVNPEPGSPPSDVVLVYHGDGDGTHASPTSRRASAHRWDVRGHHRRQWYPRTGEHKVIWIDDHTAGARDAPLVRVERVEVF